MKNILLLILIGLNISCAQKQNDPESLNLEDSNYKGFDAAKHNPSLTDLQGTWSSNELLLKYETREYFLFPKHSAEYSYGNKITLKPDQTFSSFYTASCGNDCFTTSTGKYKMIDKNYICFYLEKITRAGDCSGDETPNRDLGLYYYCKKDSIFYLLKSSGNLKKDKDNVRYREMIFAKRAEIQKFYGSHSSVNHQMFDWKRVPYTEEKQIVAFCMAENKIKNYELLYYDKGDQYSTEAIALVKIKGQYRYLIYSTWGDPIVSLYNDDEVQKIDQLVQKIDADKSLKIKSLKLKANPKVPAPDKRTVTLSKKGNEIYKVIYESYPKDIEHYGVFTLIVYYHNAVPVYIDYENAFIGEDKRSSEKVGLYVEDWENNKKMIKVFKGGGNYIYFDWIKEQINRIMEEVKTEDK